VKIMLLIRGEFQAIEGKPERLQLLLGDVKQFVMESGYDGVDVDWEYPSSAEDTALLLALMKGLRSVLPQPYLLSVDAAPFMESAYDVRHVREFVDFFNVMTYDCAGPWTAYAQLNSKIFPTEGDPKNSDSKECEIGGSDKEAADIFLADAPAEKLNQGTAFFGFEYKSVRHLYEKCPSSALTADHECDEPAVPVLKYGRDIKPLLDRAGWKVLMDDTAHVPYLVRTDGSPGLITYDDPSSTYERAWYSDWDRGLGGMFVWKLDEDYDGQSQDLLDAVYRASFRVAVTGRPDPVYQSRSGWKRLGDGNGENGHCFDYSSQP